MCGVVVVDGTPDQRMARLADHQWGRVSHEQLTAFGFTPAMIRARLRSGALRIVTRGVYAVGHTAPTELGGEAAALLVCRVRAVLSHSSAAWLHQIVPQRPPEIHVTVRGDRRPRGRPGLVVHRSRSLTRADLGRCRGMPVTSPARTLIDEAETSTPRESERQLDEALARRLVSPTSLREAIARAPGRRGNSMLEALLDPERARGITRSYAEERLLAHLRAAGIPDPERNAQLGAWSIDFYWREANLAVEVDSYKWHSAPGKFKRDRRKEQFLAQHGIRLIRASTEMIDQPLPLIGRIYRALATPGGAA